MDYNIRLLRGQDVIKQYTCDVNKKKAAACFLMALFQELDIEFMHDHDARIVVDYGVVQRLVF